MIWLVVSRRGRTRYRSKLLFVVRRGGDLYISGLPTGRLPAAGMKYAEYFHHAVFHTVWNDIRMLFQHQLSGAENATGAAKFGKPGKERSLLANKSVHVNSGLAVPFGNVVHFGIEVTQGGPEPSNPHDSSTLHPWRLPHQTWQNRRHRLPVRPSG